MGKNWTIPIIFGILFFSTIFSAQNVYGPHYTSLDGLRYDFQGTGQANFDVFINLVNGLAKPKNATFQVCVHLDTATDTRTVPIEIVSLSLVSCQPITVVGETDLNFLRVRASVPTDPIFTPSMIVDVSGFYEILNPAGKSMAGRTVIDAKDVVLGIPACIPPNCENNCNGHGTCVADDTCVCEKGWESDELCSVPDCTSNDDCSDSNQCTLEVCHDNQCVVTPIPGCDPNQRCTENADCSDGNACTNDFCRSDGTCGVEVIPGCASCTQPSDCSDGNACTNDFCREGLCGYEPIPGCTSCTSHDQCSDDDACTADICRADGTCAYESIPDCVECQQIHCPGGTHPEDTDGDTCEDTCVPDQCQQIHCPGGTHPEDTDGDTCEDTCVPDLACDPPLELCGDVCKNLSTDLNNCGACGNACSLPNAASESCSAGLCQVTSCDAGFSNCDPSHANGCETRNSGHINTPANAQNLGSHCADTRSGLPFCPATNLSIFSSQSGNSGKYFRVTAEECSDCPANLQMRFVLLVPAGIDYDLYVFDSTGTTLLGSSRTAGPEEVTVNINDDVGSVDDTNLLVEVRYASGSSCTPWTLNFFNMR